MFLTQTKISKLNELFQHLYVSERVCACLCLRVENRPSVLGIFIYVPWGGWGGMGWGGVGWGNNVHVLAHSQKTNKN